MASTKQTERAQAVLAGIAGEPMEQFASRVFLDSDELEQLTGTPAATWRKWALRGDYGPPSFYIGRRRVWRKELVIEWLDDQESAASTAERNA